ncbi:MAG: hypothetical protein WBW04_22030 [Nitrolancea sp.]
MTAQPKVETLKGVVPAVFSNSEDAEAALEELRRLGFRHDDLGIMVPDPEHHHLIEDSDKEVWGSLSTGMVAGIPIGVLAGMALTALVIPGLGAIGLGGALLIGGTGGALWGAYLGSMTGLGVEILHVEDVEHRYEIQLKPNEILVVVMAHNEAERVCEVVQRHGARCLWEGPPAQGS